MKQQVTTITLTFKLAHTEGNTDIESVRSLINKLRDYDSDGKVEVVTNDDTDEYTFVKHDGKYSRQFGFNSIDAFVKKYAKFGGGDIAAVLRDYGTVVGCDSKTERVEEDTEQNQ